MMAAEIRIRPVADDTPTTEDISKETLQAASVPLFRLYQAIQTQDLHDGVQYWPVQPAASTRQSKRLKTEAPELVPELVPELGVKDAAGTVTVAPKADGLGPIIVETLTDDKFIDFMSEFRVKSKLSGNQNIEHFNLRFEVASRDPRNPVRRYQITWKYNAREGFVEMAGKRSLGDKWLVYTKLDPNWGIATDNTYHLDPPVGHDQRYASQRDPVWITTSWSINKDGPVDLAAAHRGTVEVSDTDTFKLTNPGDSLGNVRSITVASDHTTVSGRAGQISYPYKRVHRAPALDEVDPSAIRILVAAVSGRGKKHVYIEQHWHAMCSNLKF